MDSLLSLVGSIVIGTLLLLSVLTYQLDLKRHSFMHTNDLIVHYNASGIIDVLEEDFKNIGSKWNQMDLSLIPIGTYAPEKFMKTVHIGPKEAVQIHQDVGSRFSIGMHWKTFGLSDEPMDLPPYELWLLMKKAQLPLESFVTLDPGKYVNW